MRFYEESKVDLRSRINTSLALDDEKLEVHLEAPFIGVVPVHANDVEQLHSMILFDLLVL